jgi:hypothetical protein
VSQTSTDRHPGEIITGLRPNDGYENDRQESNI